MDNLPPRHLLHIFPTFAVGGSQSRFARLVQLHKSRYRHTVISLDGNRAMAERLSAELAIEVLPQAFKDSTTTPNVLRALRVLSQYQPDALITYNWGSFDWWVAKRLKTSLPHIHLEDGFGPEEKTSQLLRRVLARRIFLGDHKTTLVVPSRNLERIAKLIWRIPNNQIRYIPNGVDCWRFASHVRNNADKTVTIGTVATLRREKNLARLIDLFGKAARQKPSLGLQLLIVGDGPEFGNLRQHASVSPHSDRIRFAGSTKNPEIFLAKMDIFALSSDTEQMPLSVIEAMASGLPIVSFDVGDVPAMVSSPNKAAASVPLDSDEEFVRNLLFLAESKAARHEFGVQNLNKAKSQFDESAMAAAYADVFG